MNEEVVAENKNCISTITETTTEDATSEIQHMLKELNGRIENFFAAMELDKDRLYVLSTRGIGDFIIAGGLSYAVQQKKNKKSTVLVIQDSKWNAGILFPNVDGIISCPHNVIVALNRYFNETENYEGENYLYANIRKKDNQYLWTEDLNMLERFKKDVFKLPIDAPFIYPIVNEISEEQIAALNEKYILNKERTIILLPHAKTFRSTFNKNFWEKVAQRLKEKNYIVYTNVAGDEKPVEGTEPLNITFTELYYITDKVKCFIGLNSGVFVFLAMTDAILLNVNPFPHWYWDIAFMFPECSRRTFYDTTEYTANLKKLLKKFDVSAELQYTHKKIATDDIFYSWDDILEAILSDVEKI